MSQYKAGTVSVTNGSQVVTGTGTAWLSNIQPGDGFTVAGTQVPYTVGSVDSDGQITLSSPYAGSSGSALAYAIWRDFDEVTGAPELSHGDIETATIFTRAVRKIGQAIAGVVPSHVAESHPHPQYLLNTDYQKSILREALLAEATLNLDFSNNAYQIYEGPVSGLSEKTFVDAVSLTRGSSASVRNAVSGISNVSPDEGRLVGLREGLLIEEQRTNLMTQSEAFTAGWVEQTTSGVSPGSRYIEIDASLAPDGTQSAERMTVSNDDDIQRIFRSFTPAAGVWCAAFFFKKDTANYGVLTTTGIGTENGLIVDLRDGSIAQEPELGPEVRGFGVEPYGNGWFRLFLKLNDGANPVVQLGIANDQLQVSYVGDGISSIYIWGGQIENGQHPSSYIKTESSQVTRSADACSRLAGAEVGTGAGTWFFEARTSKEGNNATAFVEIYDDSSNRISCYLGTDGRPRLINRKNGSLDILTSVSFPVVEKNSVSLVGAFSHDPLTGEITLSINGLSSQINAAAVYTPVSPTIFIGTNSSNAQAGRIDGAHKGIKYIPRALSSAELETLTGAGL